MSENNAENTLNVADMRANATRLLRAATVIIGQCEADSDFYAEREEALALGFHFAVGTCQVAVSAQRAAQILGAPMSIDWCQRVSAAYLAALRVDTDVQGLDTLRKSAGILAALEAVFAELEQACRDQALSGEHPLLSDADFAALLDA